MQQPKPVGLIVLFIFLGVVGQYLFKGGMSQDAPKALMGLIGGDLVGFSQGPLAATVRLVGHLVSLLLQPPIFLGLMAYVLSTACWLAVLSKTDLSFAYPMLSIGYVAVLLIGWLAFDEEVSMLRWLGVALICIGIVALYSEQFFLRWGMGFSGLLLGVAGVVGWTTHVAEPTPVFDKPVGLIAFSITLGILGQYLFKSGMNRPEYREQISTIGAALRPGGDRSVQVAVLNVLGLFVRPFVVAGVVCYGVSTVSWLAILGRTPLSFVYPLLSIGYVAILLMGWLLFREQVTLLRWFGVGLVCYGIVTIYSEEMVHAHWPFFAGGLVVLALGLSLASRSFARGLCQAEAREVSSSSHPGP